MLLNINYDTSGGFRCYNLKKIKLSDILISRNLSYSFFWESTYILAQKYKIKEIPIILPYRKIGVSKMKFRDTSFQMKFLDVWSLKNSYV